jgi:hypothetical protein
MIKMKIIYYRIYLDIYNINRDKVLNCYYPSEHALNTKFRIVHLTPLTNQQSTPNCSYYSDIYLLLLSLREK